MKVELAEADTTTPKHGTAINVQQFVDIVQSVMLPGIEAVCASASDDKGPQHKPGGGSFEPSLFTVAKCFVVFKYQ